ncbi:acetolactate synthase 3 large subunit [Isoalcanivorax beigongshangi]|uniref:Acetolactate synthase n=1 Tax=Isoalcanivorax beigongshangi TaxID=3238810 RepID=A0ABV4AM29_9GAMM
MEKLSGAEMIIRALQEEGVEYLFGYPGGAVLHIYDALFQQEQVKHILVRHEQAATHAADGYARATGKPGVVLVTSGPGATNAVTGIATAYMDSIPMVVLSGQVRSDWIGDDAFQECDMMGICRPIVKHSFMVRNTEDLPEIMRKAFYIATTGRPGPVLVDIPKDRTAPHIKLPFEYPKKVKMRSYTPVQRGHSGQIRKAVEEMLKARRPVLYAGGGVVQGDASDLLTKLAHKVKFPVTNTLMGLGCFPASDPQYIGMLGMHGTYEANMVMHNADLIVAVGARFDDRATNDISKFCPGATIVHIDVDPATISKNVRADVPIVGPVQQVLEDMLAILDEQPVLPDGSQIARWWDEINGWRKVHGLRFAPHAEGLLKPQEVIQALHRVTKGDAYVTSDVGQHQMFAAQYYGFDKPRRWINSGGLGTMGFGLPAAMGVQLAFPDATVACVTGEGSIQMNIQELSTCLQYGLPVKIINLNNQSLGMVRQWQDMQYGGRHSQSYMESLPDFVGLAQSYHHLGIRVDRADQLEAAMEEAFAAKDRLVFMDIYVDPTEHVYPMHIADGSMRDMWLSKTERT